MNLSYGSKLHGRLFINSLHGIPTNADFLKKVIVVTQWLTDTNPFLDSTSLIWREAPSKPLSEVNATGC